jgi:N-acetylglucosaminyl-diphospho-decaprenol L-rhamnosyltransferase
MMRTTVIVTCSAARLDHVRVQERFLGLSATDVERVVVWLDRDTPPTFDGATVLHTPPGEDGLRLAQARNAGAEAAIAAGADLLVFLDADCIAGASLFDRYRDAAVRIPDALLVGPVTYLASGVTPRTMDDLPPLLSPHAARPAPGPGELVVGGASDYDLFWSLSFAVTRDAWRSIGGFDETFEGYGGEDTDYAYRARARRTPLAWVGGADAFHQYHDTSSPPWQHLDDILRNGAIFARRWGSWPMGGWLEAFAAAGAIRRTDDGGWHRTDQEVASQG